MTILVTGGAGFIGSNFLHHLTTVTDEEVICIDKLTYASKVENVLWQNQIICHGHSR